MFEDDDDERRQSALDPIVALGRVVA